MKKQWVQANDAWIALTRREQMLILITLCVVPIILVFVYSIEPALKRLQGADAEIQTLELSVQSDRNILELMQKTKVADPNVKATVELKALYERLAGLENRLNLFSERLVQPREMLGLLHSVLTPNDGLVIVGAKSLPVEPLDLGQEQNLAPQALSTANGEEREQAMRNAIVFMHPFELQLQGSYSALFEYLRKLEALHEGFFWNQLTYEAGEYPKANVVLRVHTLSTEEGWLSAH